jgi:DNA-binding transcriptional MerR regulator
MRTGELAARAGVNIQTLRFYEREGLLRAPVRTASGYRSYEERDLEQVRFIRVCQGLGFSLREIEHLIQLHRNLRPTGAEECVQPNAVRGIIELANERVVVIDEKSRLLTAMRAELTALVRGLAQQTPQCPASR